MIPILLGIFLLAGVVGLGLCALGVTFNLPFSGRERAAFWLCAGTMAACGALALLLMIAGVA